jgi:hypothetical protein
MLTIGFVNVTRGYVEFKQKAESNFMALPLK